MEEELLDLLSKVDYLDLCYAIRESKDFVCNDLPCAVCPVDNADRLKQTVENLKKAWCEGETRTDS